MNIKFKSYLSIIIGLILGAYHVGHFFIAIGGAGHGGPDFYAFYGIILFGYGYIFWPLIAPFQYLIYTYIAIHRLKRIGKIAFAAHYFGAMVVFFYLYAENIVTLSVGNYPFSDVLSGAIFQLGPFIFLNIWYIRRIFFDRN